MLKGTLSRPVCHVFALYPLGPRPARDVFSSTDLILPLSAPGVPCWRAWHPPDRAAFLAATQRCAGSEIRPTPAQVTGISLAPRTPRRRQ